MEGFVHFTNCWEELRLCEIKSKLIECVQENGKLYSAIRVGLIKLRPCMEGEVIVTRPKSDSACIEEDEFAAGVGKI